MDKKTTGEDNLYYELESPKKESEAGIYDDVAVETTILATKGISYEEYTQEAKKKKKQSTQNASQSDTFLIRRLVFISTAVVIVAFLTAAATLILALSIMMSPNGDTGSKPDLKDCGAIYGKYSHKMFSLRALGNDVLNCITRRLSARNVTPVVQKRKRLDSEADGHMRSRHAATNRHATVYVRDEFRYREVPSFIKSKT